MKDESKQRGAATPAEKAAAKERAEKFSERKRALPPGVWLTANLQEIPFKKLEDGHLLRILGHLRRRAIRDRLVTIYDLVNYRPGGDGAFYACDDAMSGFLHEDDPSDPQFEGLPPPDPAPWKKFVCAEWEALMTEARSRGIEPQWTKAEDDKVRMELEGIKA